MAMKYSLHGRMSTSRQKSKSRRKKSQHIVLIFLLKKSLIHYFLHLLKITKITSPFFFSFLLLFLNKGNKYINLIRNSLPRATVTQPGGSTFWRLVCQGFHHLNSFCVVNFIMAVVRRKSVDSRYHSRFNPVTIKTELILFKVQTLANVSTVLLVQISSSHMKRGSFYGNTG